MAHPKRSYIRLMDILGFNLMCRIGPIAAAVYIVVDSRPIWPPLCRWWLLRPAVNFPHSTLDRIPFTPLLF
jgi:hypothetical protein